MATRKKDRAPALGGAASRNDDLGYPIFVSQAPREELTSFVSTNGRVTLVLCDAQRCVRALAGDLAATLGRVPVAAFGLGEARKRLTTVERVLDAMLAAGVERDSLVLGVGGGVASDLFGFSCATYMRGVRYAHVATSLVAMVDAAIGGKTGVDLRGGKNLAGVFADPVAVFAHTQALQTLPYRLIREGLAEVLKAIIGQN